MWKGTGKTSSKVLQMIEPSAKDEIDQDSLKVAAAGNASRAVFRGISVNL